MRVHENGARPDRFVIEVKCAVGTADAMSLVKHTSVGKRGSDCCRRLGVLPPPGTNHIHCRSEIMIELFLDWLVAAFGPLASFIDQIPA